jgi:hypothetical protein
VPFLTHAFFSIICTAVWGVLRLVFAVALGLFSFQKAVLPEVFKITDRVAVSALSAKRFEDSKLLEGLDSLTVVWSKLESDVHMTSRTVALGIFRSSFTTISRLFPVFLLNKPFLLKPLVSKLLSCCLSSGWVLEVKADLLLEIRVPSDVGQRFIIGQV